MIRITRDGVAPGVSPMVCCDDWVSSERGQELRDLSVLHAWDRTAYPDYYTLTTITACFYAMVVRDAGSDAAEVVLIRTAPRMSAHWRMVYPTKADAMVGLINTISANG